MAPELSPGRSPGVQDVLIVGGGLVGASLAVALSGRGLRITLVEAAAPPASRPSWDERTIALNLASEAIFRQLGVWPPILEAAAPILATHIGEQGRFGVARFSAEQAGFPALGYNVPVRAIGEALMTAVQAADDVQLRCPARLSELQTESDHVQVRIDAAGEPATTLRARLLVAADGAHSVVRQQLGIGAEQRDYGQSAVLSTVVPGRDHRGVAYERFTPEGPVALLPRPQGQCAVVWTVSHARAQEILALDEAAFLNQLQAAFGRRLGRFGRAGRRSAYPLTRVLSDELTAPRVVFAGNAAQTLHPVAAQGFNLGLRDVATLAAQVQPGSDPGAVDNLAQYRDRRRADRNRVAGFTDHLVRLFSNRVPALSQLRHLGLLGLDMLPAVKQQVMRQNLGLAADGPWQAHESWPR